MAANNRVERINIVIFGKTNSGKSTLFNLFTGTDTAIVSSQPGTTTDPVSRTMELIGFGPVVLTDTAGLGDTSALGSARIEKTRKYLRRADLALYCVSEEDGGELEYYKSEFTRRGIPHIIVYTKSDINKIDITASTTSTTRTASVSAFDALSITALRELCVEMLNAAKEHNSGLLDGLLSKDSVVLLIIPIDSAAPAGRLILPQVQLLRECLDNNIRCIVTNENTVRGAVNETKHIDFAVIDSQIFSKVKDLLPSSIKLSSFSILMARQKGDLRTFVDGARSVYGLKDGDRVLIAENCVHNQTHEDIGNVKMPALLAKLSGAQLKFDFVSGSDFPADEKLTAYSMIVHCGACMTTRREMISRVNAAIDAGVPITNYGVLFAMAAGEDIDSI